MNNKILPPYILKPAFFAVCLLLAGMNNAPLLNAQDDEEEDLLELSPFEVSAASDTGYYSTVTIAGSRTAQEIINIPGSITVLNEELLSDLNTFHVDRVLRLGVSGVTPNTAQRDDINIRGFRQQQPFRDGIEVNGFVSVPMFDVARVEVVKGPAAMTFGDASPLGGVINFVSRNPTEVSKGDIEFVAAENEFRRTTINVSGPIPISLGDGDNTISYRATLGLQHDDREKAIESDDQWFTGGALGFNFGKTKLKLETYLYEVHGYLYFNDFIDTTAPAGAIKLNPLSTENFVPSEGPNDQDIEEFQFSAQAITELNDNNTLKFFYRYRQHDEFRRHLRGIRISAEDNYTLSRQDIPLQFDFDQNVIQFDYLGSFGGDKMRNDISAGFQFVTTDNTTRIDVFTATSEGAFAIGSIDTRDPDFSQDGNRPDPIWAAGNNDTQIDTTSWYVQDFLKLWGDRLIGVGGVRWIRNDQANRNNNLEVGSAGHTSTSTNPTKTTIRYGGIFKPMKGVAIYGVHSTTFDINNFDAEFGPNKPPDSDGILDEIGIKFSGVNFMGGQLFASAAYFDMALTNVRQVGVDPVTGEPRVTFAAQNTSEGAEMDFGFTRKVGPGTLQTIITGTFLSVNSAAGDQPIESAEEVYSFFFSYNWDEGALQGLNIGFGGNFESDKPTRISGAAGGFFIDEAEIYTLFANYSFKEHWRVGITVNNLSDNQEIVRAAADGLAIRRRGRAVELSAGYSW